MDSAVEAAPGPVLELAAATAAAAAAAAGSSGQQMPLAPTMAECGGSWCAEEVAGSVKDEEKHVLQHTFFFRTATFQRSS